LGFDKQILIAHDIHTKHRLVEFGGHGYAHIPANIVPRMNLRGISKESIHNIVVENPKRWLQFTK
jgi:phosphotriesterase-related protein